MMATADLCDKYLDPSNPSSTSASVQVLDPSLRLRLFGKQRCFSGGIETVKCFEDNSFVRKTLEQPGNGRVLVVDGGGSWNCALVGDLLGELAIKNGWKGIIVFGCIRDSSALNGMEIGVLALGTNPKKSEKRNQGQVGEPVTFGGVTFSKDKYAYVDEDGTLVSTAPLSPPLSL